MTQLIFKTDLSVNTKLIYTKILNGTISMIWLIKIQLVKQMFMAEIKDLKTRETDKLSSTGKLLLRE